MSTNTKTKDKNRKALVEHHLGSILMESYKPQEAKVGSTSTLGSFEVVITVENAMNANGRLYESAVWNGPDAFGFGGKYLDENGKVKPLSLIGYADHPFENQMETLLTKGAITWTDVTLLDETWKGKAHILNTPDGKIVKTYLDYAKEFGGGEHIGVSTRADGSVELVESANGSYERVIPEGFYLAAIDFVHNPSVFTANNPVLMESKTKRKTLLESIKHLAETDEEHKEIYMEHINKVKTELNKDNEGKVLEENYAQTYRMLSRLRQDAEYFLGNGNGHAKYLWGITVADNIKEMRKLYNELPEGEKPEWLTLEDIDRYEKEMLAKPLREAEITKTSNGTILTEAEDDEDNEEEKHDIETNEDDNKEDIEKDVEDEADDIEDKEDDLEDDLENLEGEVVEANLDLETVLAAINELTIKVDHISDWLFDIEDVEAVFDTNTVTEFETDLEDNVDVLDDELDLADEELMDLTEEDIDNMTPEELLALEEMLG